MAATVARHVCVCGRNALRFSGLLVIRNSHLAKRIDVRHHARWFAPFLMALRSQVKAIESKYGPEEKKPRSHQENWDYDSELYAFGKRLGEEFVEPSLRTALTDKSYVTMEEKRREEMGLTGESAKLEMQDNQELAQTGAVFTSDYIKAYLRLVYPRLPEEGVCAIHDHLTRKELLEHVGKHLGLPDIILCAAFPVPQEITSTVLLAVIGSVVQHSGARRAGLLVRDFLLAQLVGQDVNELWPIGNPMGLLMDLLESEGRALPEARILRQAGSSTIMSVYMVGVYSNKELLGWGPGETLAIAEEEAARVALKHLFGTSENGPTLPLDSDSLNAAVSDVVQRSRLGDQAVTS